MSVAAARVPARAVGQGSKIGYPGLGALRVHFWFFSSLCRLVCLLVLVVRRVSDSVAAPSLYQLCVGGSFPLRAVCACFFYSPAGSASLYYSPGQFFFLSC